MYNVSLAQGQTNSIQININNGKFKINKKEIGNNWDLSFFYPLINMADRKKATIKNVAHTYDKLGVVIYEPIIVQNESGEVAECQFFLDKVEAGVTNPTNLFEGKIFIQKIDITKNTSIEEFRFICKDYTETMLDEYDKYKFSKEGIYFFLLYNKENKLVKLSVGKQK